MGFFKSKEFLITLGTVLVGLLITLTAVYAEDGVSQKVKDQILSPSVQMVQTREGQAVGYCSGTVIKDGMDVHGMLQSFVLTAKHCFAQSTPASRWYIQGTPQSHTAYDATLFCTDEDSDVAIMRVEGTIPFKLAHTATEDEIKQLEEQDTIYSASSPKGILESYQEGRFSGEMQYPSAQQIEKAQATRTPVDPETFPNWYGATVLADRGSSGSAMFFKTDNGEFRVAGVATQMANSFILMYTPWADIERTIDACKIGNTHGS